MVVSIRSSTFHSSSDGAQDGTAAQQDSNRQINTINYTRN